MTPTELAHKAAEAVLETIERNKAIVKAQIAEAIEAVLWKHQPVSGHACYLERPSVDRDRLCGND